ncbi:MAG: CRISPR-associated helicase Cas3' [Microvirga sp.]
MHERPSKAWAKLSRSESGEVVSWHSLVAHSADVSAVLSELLHLPIVEARLARLTGRTVLDPTTRDRLACLAFLHDLGKANRGFQARWDARAPLIGHIKEARWLFTCPHCPELVERAERALRYDVLETWFETEESWGLVDAVFAHHGRPWAESLTSLVHLWRDDGDSPLAIIEDFGAHLDGWFEDAFGSGPFLPATAEFQHAFAGLLMLADWLASDTTFFPFTNGRDDGDRMAISRRLARIAVSKVGLDVSGWRDILRSSDPTFLSAFGREAPRPMQTAAAAPSASLVILESETGSGKTEAALWRYVQLFRQGLVDGLYFALPTRVAATQIFDRVRSARDRLFPNDDRPPVVLAVPGQLRVDDVEGHLMPGFEVQWPDKHDAPERWSAQHPKRFLAAPIAVGTIDQALLGTIMTSHAHLRSTSLLRHLLVIDEVHASDVYMQGLLGNLLEYHTKAGGHALLLSATLGSSLRRRLLGLDPETMEEAVNAPYPLISWADCRRESHWSEPWEGIQKQVKVTTLPSMHDAMMIAATALDAARRGAKVLVIRNTVGSAIETASALEDLAGPQASELFAVADQPTLHHGRFTPDDRKRLDQQVERDLGRPRRPGGRVIIGTQTLEQSLDIDADLLLTDLCPVDVLLQRMGRLHRHMPNARPDGFSSPQAIVIVPYGRDLSPLVRSPRNGLGTTENGGVYEDLFAIEATWRLIEGEPLWEIPRMNRRLVEAVTHAEPRFMLEEELCRGAAWTEHRKQLLGLMQGRKQHGQLAVIPFAEPFQDLVFPDDQIFSTRLGTADLEVLFPPGLVGPFGLPLRSIRIPLHLHRLTEPAEPSDITSAAGTIRFKLGERAFAYGRLGLQRIR